MPKPVKKRTPKRPSSDPIVRARQQMDEHMAKADEGPKPWDAAKPVSVKAIISAHMAKLGSKGGKISGAKRMEMPAGQRKEIAKKAAAARWAKRKG